MKKRTLYFFICILVSVEVYAETLDATVDWAKRIELGPLVSGTVAEVNADVGDFVKQGTTLLRIDDKPYATSVTMRESQVASTTASRDNAKDELDRQQELYDIGSLSTVDLDKVNFDFIQADSAYQQSKGALTLAQLELAHTVLTAPFDGWVVKQHTVTGQKINASLNVPILFVMVTAGSYVAKASVPSEVLQRLDMNKKAVVVIGEKQYQGNVVMSENVTAGESIISIRFNTNDESYLPGTSAQIEIE